MSMTKSWYRLGLWPWQKRLREMPRTPRPNPICREITRQVDDLRRNGGLPDICHLGPGEYAAWLLEMAAQGLRPSMGFEGIPVESSTRAGVNVEGRMPPGWD